MAIRGSEFGPGNTGQMWKCTACNMTNHGNDKLCLRCGEPNQGNPPQMHTAVDSTNTKGRKDLSKNRSSFPIPL